MLFHEGKERVPKCAGTFRCVGGMGADLQGLIPPHFESVQGAGGQSLMLALYEGHGWHGRGESNQV